MEINEVAEFVGRKVRVKFLWRLSTDFLTGEVDRIEGRSLIIKTKTFKRWLPICNIVAVEARDEKK